MSDYSVGYTAGLIALAIFITQLWLPTAISFLLAGVLRDEETAATWTVAAKILQSSHWTMLLRSDSVRPHAVRTPIFLASLAIPLTTVLIAISSVLTPIGLYDVLEVGEQEVGTFSYIRDSSAYFYGTSPRSGYNFSRQCSFRLNPAPCPFTNGTLIFSMGDSTISWDYPDDLSMDIPPILRELYSSGTHGIGTTVSNFFDIEWRQLTMRDGEDAKIVNRGSPFAVNMFRQVDSVALEDSVKLVEGLIVDTQTGGVGFRNHTVPQPADRNVTWQEDILFIEPVTACVDTNLTFDYTESKGNFSFGSNGPIDYRLTDRGGFANLTREDLNRTYPYYDGNPQANPDLWNRAHLAAIVNNFYTMLYLNVTNAGNSSIGVKSFQYLNSTIGKSFPLWVNGPSNYRAATFSNAYGDYLFGTSTGGNMKYPNPFNVTKGTSWFGAIPIICANAGEGDIANVTNIFVACGLVTGPPRRVDNGPQGIFERGSKWTTPLYSCATSIRATIKTVSFSTDPVTNPVRQSAESVRGLTSFRVTNITAKTYPSPDAYPLWAVEDSGYKLRDIQPLWGLISPAYPAANFPNISTVKQPSLYLVGLGSGGASLTTPTFSAVDNGIGYDNLPAADFPFRAANTIYSGSPSSGISGSDWPFDLVGRADMAVFTRWQTLTATPDGTSRMINLLWTDLAASAVVGTKGVTTTTTTNPTTNPAKRDDTNPLPAPAPIIHIHPAVHRVKYHFAYGIPGFALLAVLALLTAGALAVWAAGWASLNKVRMRLQQLSAGRIFTIVLYPGESDFKMSPKEWSLVSGGKTVKFADGDGDGTGDGAGVGVGPAGVGGGMGEEDRLTTPGGATTVSDVASETKGYAMEDVDVGAGNNGVYDGRQHGGYIALEPLHYESR